MENMDIAQLKKDLDEILELSSQRANEDVSQAEKSADGTNCDKNQVSAAGNIQHYLQVHSLNDEESVDAQNHQSTMVLRTLPSEHDAFNTATEKHLLKDYEQQHANLTEKRRTISVTFNDENEIHVQSKATIQSETIGVIEARPGLDEFGNVNQFTQTGVSLILAAIESPKEQALRSRSSSLSSTMEMQSLAHENHPPAADEAFNCNENASIPTHCRADTRSDIPENYCNPHQRDPDQTYSSNNQQPVVEGVSARPEVIESLQFEHNCQDPVAFSMLPEDEFIKPGQGLLNNNMLFGSRDSKSEIENSNDLHDSAALHVSDARANTDEASCKCWSVKQPCKLAPRQAANQEQMMAQQRNDNSQSQWPEDIAAPESMKEDLELPLMSQLKEGIAPHGEIDECKRSVTNLRSLQDDAENLDAAGFKYEPSSEALPEKKLTILFESARDPGAGNVDFDVYPPLDTRSPIKINIGSTLYIGQQINELPEVQPGITVSTIPPEFHISKKSKAVYDDLPVEVESELKKSSIEDMVTLNEALTQEHEDIPITPEVRFDNTTADHYCSRLESKRILSSKNSYRDQDNIVTVRTDGVTTCYQGENQLPVTTCGGNLNLPQRSKSKKSLNLPTTSAFDGPLEISMDTATLARDQETFNLMSNAGLFVINPLQFQNIQLQHREPTISEVNLKIYDAPQEQRHVPCKLNVPNLIKSNNAAFEFIEQADALTYQRHYASDDPVYASQPAVNDNCNSINTLQNAIGGASNQSTLKRGMAVENLSQLNPNAAVCSPQQRNCQCEKRLQTAMQSNPQEMNFKFAPVPSGVSVLKFIDRKLMESPVGHPYGLAPQSLPLQLERKTGEQDIQREDYSWSPQGHQNYAVATNQGLPYCTSMTAVCSLTQMSQPGHACYNRNTGAGKSRSAVEDDDGYYMNAPPQVVNHVASSAWIDDNEMFVVAQQPSLHYRTPLGHGCRNVQRPQQHAVYEPEQPIDAHGIMKRDSSTVRKCKCAIKRLSKIFRKN